MSAIFERKSPVKRTRESPAARKPMSTDDELPCYKDGQNSKADGVNDSSGVVELILHVHGAILRLNRDF